MLYHLPVKPAIMKFVFEFNLFGHEINLKKRKHSKNNFSILFFFNFVLKLKRNIERRAERGGETLINIF